MKSLGVFRGKENRSSIVVCEPSRWNKPKTWDTGSDRRVEEAWLESSWIRSLLEYQNQPLGADFRIGSDVISNFVDFPDIPFPPLVFMPPFLWNATKHKYSHQHWTSQEQNNTSKFCEVWDVFFLRLFKLVATICYSHVLNTLRQ